MHLTTKKNQLIQFLHWRLWVVTLLVGLLSACGPDLPKEIELALEDLPKQVDFNIHVKPILSDRCYSCHGPDEAKQQGGLRLDLAETAYEALGEQSGKPAIVPGQLSNSELFHRILSPDPASQMPPPESGLQLSDHEKAILIRWIEQGATYKPHWAFLPPTRPSLPARQNQSSSKQAIDQFVQAGLAQKNWEAAPEASPEILLRRLYLDLNGLPPSLAEIEAYLSDTSSNAYEKVVDQLLAAPHYGERMATDWLDVARYADTHGYTVDRFRDMSPWRDWVIKAFNNNMPYDQFITWQLAGDLLPNASKEQILATGFNRNHQQNMEGGIVEEEFRVEYVADRTNTFGVAFLGLTMECARCHDHKFDPISQKNYFELFSFFNNVKEAGQISWDDATPVPSLLLPKKEEAEIIEFIKQQIQEKEKSVEAMASKSEEGFMKWLAAPRQLLEKDKAYPNGLQAHFTLDRLPIVNRLSAAQKGEMKQQHVQHSIRPNLQAGKEGKALLLDGDAWLDMKGVGVFDRSNPFSIGLWVKLPKELENGVIFHKGIGAAIYNWRGYHLALKDNRLELMLAHTAPYNAIVEYVDAVPRDEWISLMLTYDGTGTADGLKIYMNGQERSTTVENDRLYKSLLFKQENQPEPGLQIGARWRGKGAKGARVDEILVFDRALVAGEVGQLYHPESFGKLLKKPENSLSIGEKELLKNYYRALTNAPFAQEVKSLSRLRASYNETVDSVKEIMVIQEMEQARPTWILERGQYDLYGEQVFPGTPESLPPMPDELPRNRLGLAKWLMDPAHPTMARVTVNRIWQQFFGRGLVRTSEDFGNQGALPSHPELLDWLAMEFVESGWDVKALVKQIVLSHTYRQSSNASKAITEADAENIYLARGPSMRLSAEMLRDNALAVSGLLVRTIGGPSVKPYQPEGLWRMNGLAYQEDEGAQLYRRSLYTFWKRTIPNPTQSTFDAPTRSNCSVRRQKTSTPLQALVLLNDPVFVEAAKVMGQTIAQAENTSLGIQQLFRQLTGRKAAMEELKILESLRLSELKKFAANPDKLRGWMNTGAFEMTKEIDPAILAANAVVASTIINADATIVKR